MKPKISSLVKLGLTLFFAFLWVSCSASEKTTAPNTSGTQATTNHQAELHDAIKKIEPSFKPMGTPGPSDWLASYKEPGQTFDEYFATNPTLPTAERSKIYVLPLGTFTQQQTRVIEVTSGYLGAFFDLKVEQMPRQDLASPWPNFRYNNLMRSRQVKTGYILNDVLKPILPSDAAALIAFTSDDLYPDETMNYVFGQASLENRVGVWSLLRLGENADYATFLRRTLKIAAHETGHMFSMRHCTKYECVMSGTNHLGETDSRPIDACPECMAKICWGSGIAAAQRYRNLETFCRVNGLVKEADEFKRKAEALE